MISMIRWIELVLELGKVRIAQLVTLSTATGYVLASGKISGGMVLPVIGIFFLALGSGALNQYQERDSDKYMPRTKERPIPSGRLSSSNALLISYNLLLFGVLILYIGTNQLAFCLAILTVVWYNGVYTYLKKITSWAAIPGSLIGSLPPLVGWATVTGEIFSPQPLFLGLFFFIWQIPHFWLLLLNSGDDYVKAGYPSLLNLMDRRQLGRLTFIWIVATAVAIIFLPLFGLGKSYVTYFLLFLTAILLVGNSVQLLYPQSNKFSFTTAFKGINIFILVVMLLLTIDRLIMT